MSSFTTRAHFPATLPDTVASYCPVCGEKLADRRLKVTPGTPCDACGQNIDRTLVWDPGIEQSFDEADCLLHESVGIFLINQARQLLLFELAKFPFGYTVSAGHVDTGELPIAAAQRELAEEVGITLPTQDLQNVGSYRIENDSCSRGADVHQWTAFVASYNGQEITLNDEGAAYAWYDLDALPNNLTVPVHVLLHEHKILAHI